MNVAMSSLGTDTSVNVAFATKQQTWLIQGFCIATPPEIPFGGFTLTLPTMEQVLWFA